MKKIPLNLDEIRIKSFVTEEKTAMRSKGGDDSSNCAYSYYGKNGCSFRVFPCFL